MSFRAFKNIANNSLITRCFHYDAIKSNTVYKSHCSSVQAAIRRDYKVLTVLRHSQVGKAPNRRVSFLFLLHAKYTSSVLITQRYI